ncbi:MAG: riboflavin synthase [Gammaproteobacteria bacterium]|nr:riboflavin synthase [Gammaproteobacteria bacterium]
MFTGIIEAVGAVKRLEPTGGDLRVVIASGGLDMDDVHIGDSIAVNGVCLTVIAYDSTSFSVDVSNETIALTSLKGIKAGTAVNLEKAMLPTTRMGGHLVSGHVDGLGTIVKLSEDARSIRLEIGVPAGLKKYIAVKGSICIDGTSLTVNTVDDVIIGLNIVPHTQQRTIIQHYSKGTQVNLEVDLVARYLETLLLHMDTADRSKVDMDLLTRSGFVK